MTFIRHAALRGRATWSTAVYYQSLLSLPPEGTPAFLVASKRRWRGPRHIHTRADPFLYRSGDDLYLFLETQALDDPGRIAAWVARSLGPFEPIGTVLAEPFHLSYPYVFEHDGRTYLLPESQEAGALRLYRFLHFPKKLELYRELLIGKYADPSPVLVDGIWYLFATTERGLELFVTDDLVNGTLTSHPANPITNDPRFNRCGGVPFHLNGHLIRPAQDGTARYGGNLNLLAIEHLSPTEYRESPFDLAIFRDQNSWNDAGGHHISICSMPDGVAVAIDGQTDDHLIHRIFTRIWMMLTHYRRSAG